MKKHQTVLVRTIAYVLAGLMLLMVVLTSLPIWSGAQEQGSAVSSTLLVKKDDTGMEVLAVQERLRDLGYYTYKATMEFGKQTQLAVELFQQKNGLDVDGVVGGLTAALLFSEDAVRLSSNNLRMDTPKPSPTPKASRTGKLTDWFEIRKKVKRRDTFTVIDFWTNKQYKIVMVGGSNHMDFEPATKKDTEIFKSTYGGTWSWARRPVLVYIAGEWHAASVNGYPHGYETVSGNGMDGQVCLHMLNSRTHGTNAKCSQHQRCVQIAARKIKP